MQYTMYIYTVPPMNLQANLSRRGKMKLVRIIVFGAGQRGIFGIIRSGNKRKWGLRFNHIENKERWRSLFYFSTLYMT